MAVPHAVLLGTTVNTSSQPSEEACAAACRADDKCTYYNYCSPEEGQCEMDSALTWSPPRSCYLLQQTVAHPSSFMVLLGNGSDVTTTAGAPLSADLENIPLQLPGYFGLLGLGVFGSGNFPCSQSFQHYMCALKGGPAELAAACNAAQPQCTGFAATSGALTTSGSSAANNADSGSSPKAAANQIGILKGSTVLAPHQLSYSPFQIAFLQTGRVRLVPLNASDYPAGQLPGSNRSATFNVLMRPQAELRSTAYGCVIAAPNIMLPGSQVVSLSVETAFDACTKRCSLHPECRSVNWCPTSEEGGCIIGSYGLASLPPGSCSMLWEASVAGMTSVAVLAAGPGMHTVAGILVHARPNITLPGYRQHLGQALLGAYDMARDACPDSLRPTYCRGFTWREASLPGVTGTSSAVLKRAGPDGFDPRRVNWNPGLSLFVKDGVPLAEAAPPALPPGHPSATSTTEQPQAAAAGLTTAQLAGIVVGSVVGAALLAGAAVLLWRRHRRRASGSQQQLLPTAHALAPAGAVAGAAGHPLKARASLPNELPEVHVDGGEVELASSVNRAVSTPRRRAQSSPGRGGKQPLPPPPAAAAGLVAAVDLQGTAAAVLPSPFAALAGKAPLPSGPITPGGSSSSRLTVAALLAGSSSTTPLRRQQGGQPPAAAVAGDQGGGSGEERSRGGAAAMSGPGGSASPSDEAAASIAAESGQRSQALAWVDEWEDVLVPESDIQFERDAEGRPITLGSEAQMMRRLRHPCVLQLMGVTITEEAGILLMEYAPGRDLDSCMHACNRQTNARVLGWYNRGRRVALDIATGLAYLHQRRVLHLDLKPHNILLGRHGEAKIGDVGFSRILQDTHLSVQGMQGTFDWVSPEASLRPRRGQLTALRVPEDCPAEVAALQASPPFSAPFQGPVQVDQQSLIMQAAAPAGAQGEEEEEGRYEGYSAAHLASSNPGLWPHPDPLVESASLASVPKPQPTFQHAIAEAISDAQLESVIYANLKFHGPRLANGARAGFFLGDGAGVGKGRQIAAVALQHAKDGGRRVLWLSVSTDLRKDAERDLVDVGCHLPLFPKGAQQPPAKDNITHQGVWFMTYSALIQGLKEEPALKGGGRGRGRGRSAADKTDSMRIVPQRGSRLKQLITWLRNDPSGAPLIVLDECHKAKNVMGSTGGKPSKTARAVEQLPDAKVLYSSATGASEPKNLGYMTRLGLWGAKDAVEFINILNKSRTGALELTALSLKASGAYLSRTLSYQGAEFEMRQVAVDARFKASYNASVALWSLVWRVVGPLTTARKAGVYWGAHQRYFRQQVMAGKVNELVAVAKQALQDGHCVVIGLQSTGESVTNQQSEINDGQFDDLASAPLMIMQSFLRQHFPSGHAGDAAVDADTVIFAAVDALGHWMERAGGTADPSHEDLCAARCNPYQKLSEQAVAAGEAKLAEIEAAIRRQGIDKLADELATAAAEEQRLKEALRKAARAAESSGHQAQQAQRGQQPAPMSPRQAQLAAAPKQPLYPMFEKHPAKKAAVAGGGGRPAAAPAPGLAKSAPRRIMDLSDSDSEDEFVSTKPSSKQRGPAKRPSAAASKPPGGAATSKKRKASVIDDSQSESGSDNENASAAGQAGQQSGRAAAAEMQRLSADLQDAVQLRMSAERRLRQAQAAEAELQRRLSGQGPTPGAAAQGGSGAVRSARAARRAAPVSYRDDSDEDGQDEAGLEKQSAGRRSSGRPSTGRSSGSAAAAAAAAAYDPLSDSDAELDRQMEAQRMQVDDDSDSGSEYGEDAEMELLQEGGLEGLDGEEGDEERLTQEARLGGLLARLKGVLIHVASGLDLPPNPLDDILEQLGGRDAVAELTGRKAAVVRNADGKGASLQNRADPNLKAREADVHGRQGERDGGREGVGCGNHTGANSSMVMEKRVAIISDAASTGISLQADRRARNQRRRVHITLELPWSADKAIQQFGRSHRSNQASAPHYILLVTPLAGESRFASAAAKRLATLGALLHGSRHATGAGSELKSFDVDNKHGAEALDLCLTSILGREFGSIRQRSKLNVQVPLPQVPEGIQDSELLPDLGEAPATQADKRFKQFMRARLLSVGLLKPDYNGQPRMPDKKVISSYRALGQLDVGIMTIKGSSCQVDDRSLVQRDELTGAEVHHVTLAIDRGISWEDACERRDEAVQRMTAAEGEQHKHASGFYMGDLLVTAGGAKRPKLIVLASEIGKTVTGSTKLAIARPNSGDCGSMTLQELREKASGWGRVGYRLVADEKAQDAWTFWHEYTDTHCVHGDTCTNAECSVGGRHQSLHILSGAVLPIMPRLEQLRARSMWGRLGMSAESQSTRPLRIVKAVTSEGENIVGIEATVGAEMKYWSVGKETLDGDRKKAQEKEEAAAVAAAAVAQAAHAAATAPDMSGPAAAVAAAAAAGHTGPANHSMAAAAAAGAAAAAEAALLAEQEAAHQQAARVAAQKQAAVDALAKQLAEAQAAAAAAQAAVVAMARGGHNIKPAAIKIEPGMGIKQEAPSAAAAAFAAADVAQQAQRAAEPAVQVKAEPAVPAVKPEPMAAGQPQAAADSQAVRPLGLKARVQLASQSSEPVPGQGEGVTFGIPPSAIRARGGEVTVMVPADVADRFNRALHKHEGSGGGVASNIDTETHKAGFEPQTERARNLTEVAMEKMRTEGTGETRTPEVGFPASASAEREGPHGQRPGQL
ncbi:hypothetical protein COHA_004957 [Chlorella ohadii]|uniref:Protein kinase domain-containing protein n=1 Tax=Chlorella ohadii TaxID=2649997 RepID=A0AAD5H229_9CHLO|nr:hypothetical protein COHA_004957 [Chlorella ohadii]